MSWNLWKKSGECCWVKAEILWSCSLTSESDISLRVYSHGSLPECPYKIKAELALNPLTCLPAHTHTHTHTFLFTCLSKEHYSIGQEEQTDMSKGLEWLQKYFLISHHSPNSPSSKSWERFAWTVSFMYHVFAFLNIPGLLLAGLKITKNCFHLFLWRRKLKYH